MKEITQHEIAELMQEINNADNEVDNERELYFNDTFARDYASDNMSDLNVQDHYNHLI